MPQDNFGSEFRIGIAEEKRIHRAFGQDCARCLYLHAIPGIGDDSSWRTNSHAQRLQVIDKAATPVFRPISRKLGSLLPERLIIRAVFAFGFGYRFDTLLPALKRLIL